MSRVPKPNDPKAWWNNLPKGNDVCPHGVLLTARCEVCKHREWREKHDPTYWDD